MVDLSYLREFCDTNRQNEYLSAILESGDGYASDKAADLAGITRRPLQRALQNMKRKASIAGIAPEVDMNVPQPSGFGVHATSTLYKNVEVALQWVKNSISKTNQQEALIEFAKTLSEYITPAKPIKTPNKSEELDENLLSMLVLGDAHYATRSSRLETRADDIDLPKTIKITHKAIDDLIDRSPNAHKGMFVSVGDAIHVDNSNGTTHAGTSVDTSSGLAEALRAMAMTIRYAVDKMLFKFAEVSVVISAGNHDKDISLGLRMMIEFCYENEPRVSVITSPTAYHYVGWGKHMFMFHHGDKVKGKDLVALAARDQPKLWGNSKSNSRLAICGHVHHMTRQEFGGMTVESHGCLIPTDRWHAESGYGSSRNMQCVTFKKDGGRHSTIIHEIDNPENEPDLTIL